MKYIELSKKIKENKEDYISKQQLEKTFKKTYRKQQWKNIQKCNSYIKTRKNNKWLK